MTIYRKYIIIIMMMAVIILSLFSLAPHGDNEEAGFVHRAVWTVAAPIQSVLISIVDGVASVWNGYIALVDARKEAGEFRDQNLYLKRWIADLAPLEEENARLRGLLDFSRRMPLKVIPARPIAMDILGQFRTITINSGADDGVGPSSPVVNADGVVGRIIERYDSFSRVLLMIDPNSSIDGRVRRTGAQGIVQGTNDSKNMLCQFAFSLRTEDVCEGDEIVTTGLDQRFPPDLLLGTIAEVSRAEFGIFQEAKIKPAVDFTRLRELLVITGKREAK